MRTNLPLFTLWELKHLEERRAVVELPKLEQSKSQKEISISNKVYINKPQRSL